jgi:hypothetical protein
MKWKLTLAGSIILLAASLGQAAAGPTITDKRYWPNEVGPSAYPQPQIKCRHAEPRNEPLVKRAAPTRVVQKAICGPAASCGPQFTDP